MLFFRDNTIVPLFLYRMRNAQPQPKAVAFACTPPLSICRWAVQNSSVFDTSLCFNAWCHHWKGKQWWK